MIDQNEGRGEKDEAAPETPHSALEKMSAETPREAPVVEGSAEAGATREAGELAAAPIIEGQAAEEAANEAGPTTQPEPVAAHDVGPTEHEANEVEGPDAEAEAISPDETSGAPAPDSTPKRKSALLPVAGGIGAVLLCAAGYYGYGAWSTSGEAPAKIAAAPAESKQEAAKAEPAKSQQAKPEASAPGGEAAAEKSPPAAEAKATQTPGDAASAKGADAAAEKAPQASDDKPSSAPPVASPPAFAKSEAAQPAADTTAAAPKDAMAQAPAEAAPAPATIAPAPKSSDDKATQLAAQLAATRAELDSVKQRLQTVEGQLAAPKSDARAELAARDAGPASKANASARIVVAQSLLTSLKQGDDYGAQLAALQEFGSDPARLERLRAGLSAPGAAKLAASFVALAPKISAAVAPPSQPARAAGEPHGLGDKVWAFIEARAEKLVRVRPANAPDRDAASTLVDDIEQKLLRGDLAGALAERAKLPASALTVTADWARDAQARLDAEEAAKAELDQSLQTLTKRKS